MSRLPYAIGIPLVAALMVAGIGIPFGLLFLEMDKRYNPDIALITALGIALAILGGAVALSVIDARKPQPKPQPTTTGGKSSTTGRASTASQAKPRTIATKEAPGRRGSSGSRSGSRSRDDRKRSR